MGTFARTEHGPGTVVPGPPAASPFPGGSIVVRDRSLRVEAQGRVLIGGSPTRVARLRPQAAAALRDWLAGNPVANRRGDRVVARRLISLGLLHPRPDPLDGAEVDVVVPVRNRPEQLSRLLGSLGDGRCIVVDDASERGPEIEKRALDGGAEYVRLDRHSGPAAARNVGLTRARTPLVAFVDSDCIVSHHWLDELGAHFFDPRVALVAPRVTVSSASSWLGRYEAARSPLDMGPEDGLVAPGNRISYVPSAAMVLRRAAVSVPCFDERLGAGEDVDLVWRLVAAGWDVRYAGTVEVLHESDVGPRSWLARRAVYGSTAGPLALRHPAAVAPARLSPAAAAIWVFTLARRPGAAAAVATCSTGLLARRLRGLVEHPGREAARLSLVGNAGATRATVTGLTRSWGPALVGVLALRRLGRWRVVAALALVVTAGRGRSRRPALDPLRFTAIGLADDLAYGAGLWWGCWRARTLRPLVPALVWSRKRARPTMARPAAPSI